MILGVDFGEKNIGIAISDETELIATPLPFLRVKDYADAVAKLIKIVKDNKVRIVVFGIALGVNREETDQSIKTRYFADLLKNADNIKIEFWNETLSSEFAKKNLVLKKSKKNVHSVAAGIILQEYLDYQRSVEKRLKSD